MKEPSYFAVEQALGRARDALLRGHRVVLSLVNEEEAERMTYHVQVVKDEYLCALCTCEVCGDEEEDA
jgi:predicted kinase